MSSHAYFSSPLDGFHCDNCGICNYPLGFPLGSLASYFGIYNLVASFSPWSLDTARTWPCIMFLSMLFAFSFLG